MEKILLKGMETETTVVSNIFIDRYMAKANGEYVKVYLYLLRELGRMSQELSVESIAEKLEDTERDILKALKYWNGNGVITVQYGKNSSDIISIQLNNLGSSDLEKQQEKVNVSEEPQKQAEPPAKTKKSVVSEEKLMAAMADEDFKMMFHAVEVYLGKTLSQSEINTIMYLYDELQFTTELIEYLVEYCVSNGHKAIKYIEKVAINWHAEGIGTVAEAKKFVSTYTNNCYPVLKAFGITGRKAAATEEAFIVKWTDEYGFDMSIILDACNRTIETIHQPSFQYADSILQRWRKKGVKSLADLPALDQEHEKEKELRVSKDNSNTPAPKNYFNSFKQRDYDYDALEKMLLARK